MNADIESGFQIDRNAVVPIGFGQLGIWLAGGAPTADSSNDLYVITGNGNLHGNSEYGDSFPEVHRQRH